ncbi:zinc ribbon domain-containing protein [Ktedonospora formicarum]|uniref:Zinc-ribbon domain-containing protein n=1 Tax=Ktedonospora formicarum TaxID=2778364 RepID=A0A8J3I6B2_9CHLR|nr:zinc ribbon domain-containing protein [Ktedonospora formicarum]GHO45504.1 hypothetical protein KSX_36670 [Ktedonospora formicarum]
MHCGNCGAKLPQGAQSCPFCGAAASYNNAGGIAPTQMAPSSYPQNQGTPSYTPNAGGQQVDPTVLAQPQTYPNAGGQPGGYYNQGSSSPNNVPSTPYYGSQPGISGANYDQPPMTPNASGANYNPYAGNSAPPPPPTPQPYMPGPGPSYPMPPQPPRKKSNVGLIIGIIAGVLVLACIGASFAAYQGMKNVADNVEKTVTTTVSTPTSTSDSTPEATPTTSDTSQSPSGVPVNPEAAKIITNALTTSGIDSDYKPTNPTTSFTSGSTVYVTYNLHLSGTGLNFDKGDKGYVYAIFYLDKSPIAKGDLPIDRDSDRAYFSYKYSEAGQGQAEIYWCLESTCSDRQLAQVVAFTVS